VRRANLLQYATPNFVVLCRSAVVCLNCGGNPILEKARETLRLALVAGEHGFAHFVSQHVGIIGQQIAADPVPQCFERGTCDAARMLVVAMIVDEKRLKWLEQNACRIFDTRTAVALFTHDAAQFLEDETGAGNLFAAQHGAFELADQQRTRSWRKLA